MKTLVATLVRNVWNKCFRFPTYTTEVLDSKEHVMLIVLKISTYIVGGLFFLVIYKKIVAGYAYHGVTIQIFSTLLLLFLFCIYLTKKKLVVLSSMLLIGTYLIGSLTTAIYWGFDVPTVTLSYVLVIIITSVLLGTRSGLLMTAFLTLFIITLGYYQIKAGPIDNNWRLENPEIIDTITYSIIFCGVMSLSWLVNKEKDKILKKLIISEDNIKEERDNLEFIVERRTLELKVSEQERLRRDEQIISYGKKASQILHDIASPFTSLKFYVEKIEESNVPSIKNHLSEVGIALQRITSFFSAFSNSVKQEEEKIDLNIDHSIEQLIRFEKYRTDNLNIEIMFTEKSNSTIFGNELCFYQIIKNIICNSIDALHDISKNKTIRVKTYENDTEVFIEIFNNGPKIPLTICEKIFDPFFTTKKNTGGLGIGLYGAKSIIENRFNGTINFTNSIKDTGVTFILTLNKKNLSN